jgi:hypothetical protein
MIRPLQRPIDTYLRKATIGNSITMAIGDVIQPGATTHAGAVVQGTSGLLLGVVLGIEQNGKISELGTVTTSSTNETTNTYVAVYIPTWVVIEYEADLSNVSGTTANSNLPGFFNFVSGTSGGNLDETSYVAFSGTVGQFFSYGVTSYNTSRVKGHFYKTL